jgi:riboflavin-specific deaminase-like protein
MFIFSNLATSLDGKIATSSRKFCPLGTDEDLKIMQEIRFRADALIMGASTFRAFRKPCWIPSLKVPAINAALSSSLEDFSPNWDFFRQKGLSRILFVGHQASTKRLKKFERSSEIVVLKKPTQRKSTAMQIVQEFDQRGVSNLLIEGGGSLMWDFASQNLIDEYHVTLTPKIVGGNRSPTLVDGLGFSEKDILRLKLMQCRVIGEEIFLTYRK